LPQNLEMTQRKLLTGNAAAAWGARLADVDYIPAFPITPQTEIIELLAQWAAEGKIPARFVTMDSEHSWTAWACATNRPDSEISYTNNWPAEALIGNTPTGSIIIWSVISFVILLAGIGALAGYFAIQKHAESDALQEIPEEGPLLGLTPTPSMRAALKYFWTVTALSAVAHTFTSYGRCDIERRTFSNQP
jgi:hypothetical protein